MDTELGKILVTTAKMSRKKANLAVWKQDAKCFSLVLRKERTTAAYNNLQLTIICLNGNLFPGHFFQLFNM